ncbi:unnamed protein product [Hyaloperonospora brassicae]|uniref:RxLR effector candidate protein n=1 Tax=Hyaloperonospora brassicae TaxID=162125 RepID=A0AAV0UBE7_HYABA|nr:unnamed protein product [Hyaloperonospora brassicae]
MRIHGLLCLVFFVVNGGVLTHAAALDPSDAHRPETAALTAEELSKTGGAAVYKRALNDRSKEERGPVLDSIFGPLKRVFQGLLDKFGSFRSRRPHAQPVKPIEGHIRQLAKPVEDRTFDVIIAGLLYLGRSPEQAFKTLQSRDDGIYRWFKYIALHQPKSKKEFPDNEAVQLLERSSVKDEAALASIFARLMDRTNLRPHAEPVQRLRFQNMVMNKDMTPSQFEGLLLPSGRGSIAALSQRDPLYRAHKAFSLEYAKIQGPGKQKELESLYSMNDGAKVADHLAQMEKNAH